MGAEKKEGFRRPPESREIVLKRRHSEKHNTANLKESQGSFTSPHIIFFLSGQSICLTPAPSTCLQFCQTVPSWGRGVPALESPSESILVSLGKDLFKDRKGREKAGKRGLDAGRQTAEGPFFCSFFGAFNLIHRTNSGVAYFTRTYGRK